MPVPVSEKDIQRACVRATEAVQKYAELACQDGMTDTNMKAGYESLAATAEAYEVDVSDVAVVEKVPDVVRPKDMMLVCSRAVLAMQAYADCASVDGMDSLNARVGIDSLVATAEAYESDISDIWGE